MIESTSKASSPWLIASLLLLFLGTVLYLYDLDRSDEELYSQIQQGIQEDFEASINYHRGQSTTLDRANYQACRLTYGSEGQLIGWTNSRYLPSHEEISQLSHLSYSSVVQLQQHTYYQIRQVGQGKTGNQTSVTLIPIYIKYAVANDFLDPYIFLGRWQETLSAKYRRRILVHGPAYTGQAKVVIRDLEGKEVLKMSRLPLIAFRMEVRMAIIICLVLALCGFVFFLRAYTIQHWSSRYIVNWSLVGGILVLRGLLYWADWPGKFLESELFSPGILAFHGLAPSLGDLTINIFTLSVIIWVVYTHFLRLSNLLYHRLLRDRWLAWPAIIASIGISSLLLTWYINVFEQITINSKVEIEFSNIFNTDFYSYLILLDVGLLLLSLVVVMLVLLRINVLYLRRYGWSVYVVVIHVLLIGGINYFLHQGNWPIGLIIGLSILAFFAVLWRQPYRSIFKMDLVSYLMVTMVVSLLVTYNVVLGVRINQEHLAQEIAERVLSSPSTNTMLNHDKAKSRMIGDMEEIRAKREAASDDNDFRDWLNEQYLRPNFKGFDVSLFLYDSLGNRMDDNPDVIPTFGLDKEFPLSARGGFQLSPAHPLHQIPNPFNEIVDIFVSSFDLYISADSAEKVKLLIELVPTSREVRGLYPSLTMEQSVYDDVKLINSFDHAIYRNGILYSKRGRSTFPVKIDDATKEITSKTTWVRGDYHEYLEPIGREKLVVVRYPKQSFVEVVTTFSFIFYFFAIGSLVFIGIPALMMQAMRRNYTTRNIPLRTKIRLGLVSISVMPMLVIMSLLYPFVSHRYQEEARETISDETLRLLTKLEPTYNAYLSDPLHRLSELDKFRKIIRDLEGIVNNDINVYNQEGVRLATTQPLITDAGIRTDLMNEIALKKLGQEGLSDLVIEETIGNIDYLSGYRPILGKNGIPTGYINVPYLGQQDALEEQVINFLAYLANIYLVVFLLINVMAVGISGTITKPLTLVQQRLSATTLGNVNKRIEYQSRDEIGAIVSAYNQMLTKLETSEHMLAQSQREMAWRQMARQVAHEIKNPLTPMRLNIQHLMRAWKEQSPRLEKMFPKVMTSLMVQIDSLVRIANSFHEFAKMPEPIKGHLRLNEVLLEVVDLYTQSEEAIWLIDIPQEAFWTYADRDQLSRCFNNIIKNALQSLEDNGIIHVSMRVFEEKARVEIKDNGKGMSAEIQKKIFEPSFSTKTSGMGLGLAIVRRIVEHAGGSISFRSEEGVGTTFFIELPRTEAPSSTKQIEEKANTQRNK